jgi:hypothetical protein
MGSGSVALRAIVHSLYPDKLTCSEEFVAKEDGRTYDCDRRKHHKGKHASREFKVTGED